MRARQRGSGPINSAFRDLQVLGDFMFDFISDFAAFTFQALVILVCLLVVIGFIASIITRDKGLSGLTVTNLNHKLAQNRMTALKMKLSKKAFKKELKQQKAEHKKELKKPTVFVLNFEGDIQASATEAFREEITTVLSVAQKTDQVVIKVESPGGVVHGYGLASSQIQRIKEAGIPLTICVDKIAASGGYMMACLADKIVAAPFAIIGSIGVAASLTNFHKVLKKHDVDHLEITAGEYKRTITPLGEITQTGLEKTQSQIQEVHELFKNHVSSHRSQADMSTIATGEYWYGKQAKELFLVDEMGTSDDLLMGLDKDHQILEIQYKEKKSLKERLGESLSFQIETLYNKLTHLLWKNQFQA